MWACFRPKVRHAYERQSVDSEACARARVLALYHPSMSLLRPLPTSRAVSGGALARASPRARSQKKMQRRALARKSAAVAVALPEEKRSRGHTTPEATFFSLRATRPRLRLVNREERGREHGRQRLLPTLSIWSARQRKKSAQIGRRGFMHGLLQPPVGHPPRPQIPLKTRTCHGRRLGVLDGGGREAGAHGTHGVFRAER